MLRCHLNNLSIAFRMRRSQQCNKTFYYGFYRNVPKKCKENLLELVLISIFGPYVLKCWIWMHFQPSNFWSLLFLNPGACKRPLRKLQGMGSKFTRRNLLFLSHHRWIRLSNFIFHICCTRAFINDVCGKIVELPIWLSLGIFGRSITTLSVSCKPKLSRRFLEILQNLTQMPSRKGQ